MALPTPLTAESRRTSPWSLATHGDAISARVAAVIRLVWSADDLSEPVRSLDREVEAFLRRVRC